MDFLEITYFHRRVYRGTLHFYCGKNSKNRFVHSEVANIETKKGLVKKVQNLILKLLSKNYVRIV